MEVPRLSPELQYLIIDYAAADEFEDEDQDEGRDDREERLATLAACARVCKSWYRNTVPYLWRNIELDIEDEMHHKRVASLLSAIVSKPERMADIRRLSVKMCASKHNGTPRAVQRSSRPNYANHQGLFVLCEFLPAVPVFSLKNYHLCPDDFILPDQDEVMQGASPMAYLLQPFLNSSILTTFQFSGKRFNVQPSLSGRCTKP